MARNRIIPIFVSHIGCPHMCVFCNQRTITGETTRITGTAVKEIIHKGINITGPDAEVAFYGGSFTCVDAAYQEELLGAVQPWVASGDVTRIRISTRPDAISVEILKRLKNFGVTTIELGCQSMDDEVLVKSGRGHNADCVRNAVELIRQTDMEYILQMMTGLPGSTPEKDMKTAHILANLRPNGVRVYPTIVVEGTELCRLWEAGLYQPQTMEEAVELCARLSELFHGNNIPVLRFGLQPTDTLTAGEAIAGPYHPAFGEMVKSRVALHEAVRILRSCDSTDIILTAPPQLISILIGQHHCNETALKTLFPNKKISIVRNDSTILKECLKSEVITVKI